MKILVTCKRVPNPEQKLKIADGKLDLSGASWQVNTFDEYAAEAALRLTERGKGGEHVGEVVVVCIGPKDSAQHVRGILAMGADRGLLVVSDENALDPLGAARILKSIVEREQPDMVLMGKQAVDTDAGQVGPMLAALLGWPQATFCAGITVAADGRSATAAREIDNGVERKQVQLPAVLTVDLRIIQKQAVRHEALAGADASWEETQRYASLKGIMAAKKKELRELQLSELGVAASPLERTVQVTAPPARQAGRKVASVDELVERLRQEAKVL